MATDPYAWSSSDPASPARDAVAITPSDSTNLTNMAKSLYIGGAGNVSLITAKGTTVSFVGLPAGSLIPVQVSRVMATGTTATNIVGLL